MQQLWSFLGRKRNRDILAWAGGGLAVALTGLWVVLTYVFPPSKPGAGVSANCGSIAVGRDISGSTVSTQATGIECPPKKSN